MNKIKPLLGLMVIFACVMATCTGLPNDKNEPLTVSVSILPEKYFVERIGGERVSVNVMVGPGDSPHSYEPKPAQMAALSRSLLYFRIGVEFENAWMDRIATVNPSMQIIDLSEGIEKIPMAEHYNQENKQDEENEHGALDPHIWTSPNLVRSMAERIYQALSKIDPQHDSEYKANLDAFLDEISSLDSDIRQALENLPTRKFMVFHPAWAYFAADYGLEQIPVEIGGTEPSAAELADLITLAKGENIRIIFAQPEFSTQTAQYIAEEIGGQVVLISPLAEDWLENLRTVALTLAELL